MKTADQSDLTGKTLEEAYAMGRADERRAIVERLRKDSRKDSKPREPTGLASALLALMDAGLCGIGQGLADYFERGGHLEGPS